MKRLFLMLAFLTFTNFLKAQDNHTTTLQYGESKQQTFDLFLPEIIKNDTPVLALLHGGAWVMGGKEYTNKTAKDLRDMGFVVANIDYRYVNDSVHANDLLEDIDNAVKLLINTGDKKGFNAREIHLAGISAGAHLALLYGYTTRQTVKSISALCAPSKFDDIKTFRHLEKHALVNNITQLAGVKYSLKNVSDSAFSNISPYNKIRSIPTLLIHGTKDDLVDYTQSENLYLQLQKKGVKSKLVSMEGKGHDVGMNQPDSEAIVLSSISGWIKTHK